MAQFFAAGSEHRRPRLCVRPDSTGVQDQEQGTAGADGALGWAAMEVSCLDIFCKVYMGISWEYTGNK